jgi:hypothetical protein
MVLILGVLSRNSRNPAWTSAVIFARINFAAGYREIRLSQRTFNTE